MYARRVENLQNFRFLHIAYLPLVQASILYGTVWSIQRFKCVTHVFVPQPGLFFIWNIEDFPYLLFNCVYIDRNGGGEFFLEPMVS